jgi:hypothetical protein
MADYSMLSLMRRMREAGFTMNRGLIRGFAVSLAENSQRKLDAVYVNSDEWHSRDRGPWQINDHWHPEVTDLEAFNLAQSCIEAYRISSQGSNFSSWAAYTNGNYERNLEWAYTIYALDEALKDVDAKATQLNACLVEKTALSAEVAQLQAQVGLLDGRINILTQQVGALQGKIDNARAALA